MLDTDTPKLLAVFQPNQPNRVLAKRNQHRLNGFCPLNAQRAHLSQPISPHAGKPELDVRWHLFVRVNIHKL
jgi:hypothetical protein